MARPLLIIADDATFAELLSHNLESAGYAVTTTASCSRAVEQVVRATPDALLVNLTARGSAPQETCRTLRSSGYLGGIIVVSNNAGELERVAGLDAEDYVNMFAGADRGCDATSPGNLLDQAPTFQTWSELRSQWIEVEHSAIADDRVTALKEPMARCLEQRSGLSVSVANPATRYLSAVDGAPSSDMSRLATIYADCGKDYFAMVQKLMLEERPQLVEQNREVLETFTGEVVALGYSP